MSELLWSANQQNHNREAIMPKQLAMHTARQARN
jgi:hypothetical protein